MTHLGDAFHHRDTDMGMTELTDGRIAVRPATETDRAVIVAIRSAPEVHARWGGEDQDEEFDEAMQDDELAFYVIVLDGAVVGAIQWTEEQDPQYRSAGIDIFVGSDHHGQGIGTAAVRLVCAHLIDDVAHHRLTIDPAADNGAAIACYSKVGFKPVGIMRQYERGSDGTFHDGLLMNLLAGEFIRV